MPFTRDKARVWEPIAEELALPWKAVERIYWQFHRERTTIRKSMRRNREKPTSRRTSPKELTPTSGLHSVTETPRLLGPEV
jgi:hypothetical protein